MAEIRVPLPKGSKYGERTATAGVLRELTVKDIIGAGEDAEKVMVGADREYHLVQSPTMAGFHLLRRQLVRLEDEAGTVVDGPLDPEMVFKLEAEDFLALQEAAQGLDRAAARAVEGMAARGRGHPAS